jgi:hypothetical protein
VERPVRLGLSTLDFNSPMASGKKFYIKFEKNNNKLPLDLIEIGKFSEFFARSGPAVLPGDPDRA